MTIVFLRFSFLLAHRLAHIKYASHNTVDYEKNRAGKINQPYCNNVMNICGKIIKRF